MRRGWLLMASLGVLSCVTPILAHAAFTSGTANAGNAIHAGTVQGPMNLTSAHALNVAVNPNTDSVSLSWDLDTARSLPPDSFRVERANAAPGGLNWITLAAAWPASTNCVGSPAHCTYIDSGAAVDQQYAYRVSALAATWSAGPAAVLAYSMQPGSAYEDGGVAAADLTAVSLEPGGGAGGPLLATSDTGRIYVCSASAACGSTSGRWRIQALEAVPLHGVALIDASHAWAVGGGGSGGVVFACRSSCDTTAAAWAQQTLPGGTGVLRGVVFLDAANGWTVGDAGAILFTSNGGANWTRSSFTGSADFRAVAAGSRQDVLAVGAGGAARHCVVTGAGLCNGAGNRWRAEDTQQGVNVNAVVFAAGHVYNAAGDAGNVFVDSAGAWSGTQVGASNWLAMAVAGTTEWLAGGGGHVAVCTYNADQCAAGANDWTSLKSGAAGALRGVAASGATSAWAVGAANAVVHTADRAQFGFQPTSVSASELANLEQRDAAVYTTGRWPRSLPGSAAGCATPDVLFLLPVQQPLASVRAATATISYSMSAAGGATRLLYSSDSSSQWTAAGLPAPTTSVSTVTVPLNLTGGVSAQLQLCFQAANTTPATVSFDLVHVDLDGS